MEVPWPRTSDGTVVLWDVLRRQPLSSTFSQSLGVVWSVAISRDGKLLAAGSLDGTVRIWDLTRGTLLRSIAVPGGIVNSVAFSPDGGMLAVGDANSVSMQLWDTATGKALGVR